MSEIAVKATALCKKFRAPRGSQTPLKAHLTHQSIDVRRNDWALKDVNFEVPFGSSLGLIGPNGAGKSTALKVMAGIYRPSSGTLRIYGRVSPLLELGGGFHPDLSGLENIRLSGIILGLTRKEINASMDEIVDFSGLGERINEPIRAYSSGMKARLGFSVAANIDPQVLIVDEIISTGDEAFRKRSNERMRELVTTGGTTVILATHSMQLIRELCDQTLWLNEGSPVQIGESEAVADAYVESVREARIAEAADGL